MSTKTEPVKYSRGEPHAVYQLLGPHGLILYIGMTWNLRARFGVHKSYSKDSWWPLVESHEAEWFPNWRSAVPEETRLLRLHRPLCNRAIPDANGKHTTVMRGLVPVRSLWQQLMDITDRSDGATELEVIERVVQREVDRLKEEALS